MGNLRPRKAMEVPLHTQVSFQTQIVGTSYNRAPPSLIYFIFIYYLSYILTNGHLFVLHQSTPFAIVMIVSVILYQYQ